MAPFDLTLDQLIELFLPTGFSVSTDFRDRSVKTWQLFLWESIEGITEENRFTLSAYPEKALGLFAALVVHDALNIALTSNYLDGLGAVSAVEGAESNGGVKKISTGPTEVEFHDGVSALAKLISASKGNLGILGELNEKACMFASQLGIQLPFCAPRKVGVGMIKGGITVPNIPRMILRNKR